MEEFTQGLSEETTQWLLKMALLSYAAGYTRAELDNQRGTNGYQNTTSSDLRTDRGSGRRDGKGPGKP